MAKKGDIQVNNITNNAVSVPRVVSAREQRVLDYHLRKSTNSMYGAETFGFFKILFFVLFIFMVFDVIYSNDRVITFSSLLEGLADSPVISSDWVTNFADLTISSDWGIFNFFRDFLNLNVRIISFLLYVVNGLVQVVVYFTYLMRTFFLA